jgi:hypothetical protein
MHYPHTPWEAMAMLEKLAGCSDGATCPTVWADGQETVIVQGYEAAGIEALPPTPDGETRIRVPRSLLIEAAGRLQ